MKIILSRKGFDSAAGGCASPIFEDGSLLSLPIPESFRGVPLPSPESRVKYADIRSSQNVGSLVEDLTKRRRKEIKSGDLVHLDPDLRRESLVRKAGWRPLFGQSHAAQGHLEKHCVGVGDIFLFFGWFKEVEQHEGRFRFRRGARDQHVLFGWLEVGAVWRFAQQTIHVPAWAKMHPHATLNYGPSNTIYVARDANAAGTFSKITEPLILTRQGKSRSYWKLPNWFHPGGKKSCLSYHDKTNRWSKETGFAYLSSVGRGQEFVLDTDDYPEAEEWARRLIAENGG